LRVGFDARDPHGGGRASDDDARRAPSEAKLIPLGVRPYPPTVVGLGYDASDRMYVIVFADFVWELYTAWFVPYREQ